MMGGNMNQMMKQIQKMQSKILEAQEKAGDLTVEATAGGGAVKVVVTGKKEIKELVISKDVIDPEDAEMLQDLVVAAINEGLKKADEMVQGEMAKVTGGVKIPGLF